MKKAFLSLFILRIVFLSVTSFALEPTNLSVYKQIIIRYHDSGFYQKDVNKVIEGALHYLKFRIKHLDRQQAKPAIVLDIDETSISNYKAIIKYDFGGTKTQHRKVRDRADAPPIMSTLRLYKYAKAHQIAVFFVTGRPEIERQTTIKNLLNAGYVNWDGLFLRPNDYKIKTISVFKSTVRKQLTEQGYDIILNIGDQKSDLAGGYADRGFKLPNPYYFLR